MSITDDDVPFDRLMPLVADPRDIDGFDPQITDYMVGVAASVTQSTITPTAFRSDDAITIDGTTVASGSAHTVNLSAGLNTFEVVVSSVGSSDPTTYTVYIGRGTTGHGGWKAGDDLDTLRGAGNTSPTGVWSNGNALWIADSPDGMLYAYTLAGGARDSSKDIALDADNASPAGIWSDNTTIRVADQLEGKVYAYTLADGARDSSRDIALSSDNGFPWGIWSNDTTIWVVDVTDDKLYAYTLAGGARDSDRDIDLTGDNTSPRGIWSDETTIWVADSGDDKLYAYTLADGDRAAGHDIDLHSSNADPAGVWGNGDTEWVANSITEGGSPFDRVYTYNNVPVAVSFEQGTYTVAEGGDVTVTVTLTADPKRKVVVPITAANQDGASNGDYSGVPANVTFNSGDTEKSFTFTATDDTVDDDGESVKLGFGTFPAGVTGGTTAEAVVSITDDDLSVSFEQATYEAAEGKSVEVKVILSSAPAEEVTIPITKTEEGGATSADYSGVPASVTFAAGQTVKSLKSGVTEATFTLTAVDDSDDDGESVELGFGSLPAKYVPGANERTMVYITDDEPSDRLMSLVVAPRDIDGFDSEIAGYKVGVAAGVTQATITPTAFRSDDAITIGGTTVASGSAHAVNLSAGLNTFEVVVSSVGSSDPTTYTVYIGRGTTEHGGWKAGDDLDTLRAAGNTSPTGVWSNGATIWAANSMDGKLYAYTLAGGARDSSKDIALDADNASPAGIWSDNTTIRVADQLEGKVYAYTLADGDRDSSRDIDLSSDNDFPWGIWSNETTIWVVDVTDDKLYAYTLAGGARDSSKDIDLTGDNTSPRGIWSDETTIWVADSGDDKLYAYTLAGGDRAAGHDIGLHSSNADAAGVWGNGDTAWVANSITESGSPFDRVYTYNNVPVAVSFEQSAYTVAEGDSVTVKVVLSADPKRQVVVPITASNKGGASNGDYSGVPANVTFESGETEKEFTFTATDDTADDDDESVRLAFGTLPAGVMEGTTAEAVVSITDDDLPTDRLITLVVSPKDIDAFEPGISQYMVGVAPDVNRATITATGYRSDDTIRIDGTEVANGDPHTVSLRNGLNNIPVVVNSSATTGSTTYRVYIGRGSTDHGRWKAGDDLDTLRSAGNTSPSGIWSDGATMWVSDEVDAKLYAYSLASGARDPSKDITLGSSNDQPGGIWSDGTTIWVVQIFFFPPNTPKKVFAYTLADGARDSGKDLDLIGRNANPSGIWSDGDTVWVLDSTDRMIYAYALADGARDQDKEIALDLPGTQFLEDIWSNGATIWVAGRSTGGLFAYDLATGDPIPGYDIGLHSANANTGGVWGNGDTVWVGNQDSTDTHFGRLYTYNNIPVAVSFEQGTYTVAESDDTSTTGTKENEATVTVTLSADPVRKVTIPINKANQGGASNGDYSGVPANVTFNSGETEKTFTFTATDDTADDDDESVKLSFGTLPAGVAEGTIGETTVSITDDDDLQVSVSFEQSAYTVAEGDDVTVKVTLSADPKRQVVVPITASNQDGASNGDYSGVPANVTFNGGESEKTFTFTATDDTLDDDGESVKLGFGTLPTWMSEGTINETTVSITDDDDPQVSVSFEQSAYTVAEGDDVTVTLSEDPERTVTIPITATNESGTTSADYSGVPANVTFNSGDTEKTFTFSATDDMADDDDESVKLGFGTLPDGVAEGTTAEAVVSITDDDVPEVVVNFRSVVIDLSEGESFLLVVGLSADPERTVTIPFVVTHRDGATADDYSGVPANIVFQPGQTVTSCRIMWIDDNVVEGTEIVQFTFGTLPDRVTEGTPNRLTFTIYDPDPRTVSFGSATYSVEESDDLSTPGKDEREVEITVNLELDADHTFTIPITATHESGATSADYSGVPANVTFNGGESEKTFTFTATDDTLDDDGESVKLGFGTLPAGVTEGTTTEAVVSITDNDDPQVSVNFEQATYTVAEGDDVTVKVTLTADPERQVVVPITASNQGGAFNGDYSGVPADVTFESGETEKSFTFTATDDTVDDDDESVKLTFGTLPTRVSEGSTDETTVNITDDDDPQVSVSFEQSAYTVAEGDSVTVKVVLSADPERTVTIPISKANQGGASNGDYSGVPANVTFNSGDTEKTFSFSATDDTVDDDDESVKLTFGSLPSRVSEGSTDETTVNITDDDDPRVRVSFEQSAYTVAEGDSVTVKVVLSADPERTVTIPVSRANQGGAGNGDYSGVPANVTFNSGNTEKTFTFSATDDTVDDDDESVKLTFGSLPSRVSEGSTDETTVNITDDDDPRVRVSFEQSAYTVAEGDSVTVKVVLSADPERTVTIPVSRANQGGAGNGDYSGVPANVTFNSGNTEKTFTFSATDDTVDDDDESVKLTFGSLPSRVSEGSTDETTVNITDDDDPQVSVSFESATYTVAEGDSVTVKITLSADPERTVTIPISRDNQGGAGNGDYSGVPANVTFNSGDTEKTFTFSATDDTVDDDDESVKLTFGSLPSRVSEGSTDEITISITDDDDPQVSVSFESANLHRRRGRQRHRQDHPQCRPRAHGDHPSQQGQPGRGLQRGLQRRPGKRHLQQRRYGEDLLLHRNRRHR